MIDNFYYHNINIRLFLYTLSRQNKILRLLNKRIFQVVNPRHVPVDIRVFNSRFVDEIKNTSTNKAFQKFRLVVQSYSDFNEDFVLI